MRLDAWKGLNLTDRQFVTVTLDTSAASSDTEQQVRLRWEAAHQSLQDAGAPERLLQVVGARFITRDRPVTGHGRCVVAASADGDPPEVVLDQDLPESPADSASFAPVPDLLPIVRAGQRHPPHLRVDLDRTGADIAIHGVLGEHLGTRSVTGQHDVIHKVRAGEASEQRLQRRAEDSWERNAADVGRALEKLSAQYDPSLIAVAGDVRAVAALQAHSTERVRRLLTVLETGGRAAGTDPTARAAAVRRALDATVVAEVEEAVARLFQAEGRQDRAAQGSDEVEAAFDRGQVDTLLLADPPLDRTRAAWLLAAALQTDAVVVLVPPELSLPEGAAAVLRWNDPATPHDSGPSMPGHGEQPGWQP